MLSRRTTRRRGRATALALAATLALGAVACSSEEEPAPAPAPTSPVTAEPVALTFAVWGAPDEIAAYESMVAGVNALLDGTEVVVQPYRSRAALVEALRGDDPPDVYLVSRSDLAWVREEERNVPVDELLDERGLPFGDRYSRSALEAFSADRRLQCMPYGISPTVIFYNKDFVDFERMEARDLDVPGEELDRWSFEEFEEAARFATRKRKRVKGVSIEPSLRALTPFVYSGGGQVFDDDDDPSSLNFSDDSARESLERVLTLLRDPTVTLSEAQLARQDPVEWFVDGRVAMIEGDRSLVPRLRQVQGLDFDVMPMPTLDSPATVGDITGLCISPQAASVQAAADFLFHALSTDAVSLVTRAGYLVPANQAVALTDDFLQPGRQPANSQAFTISVAAMRVPPLLEDWAGLEAAVDPILQEMLDVTVLDDLEAYTTRIDEASRAVLDPESVEEEQLSEVPAPTQG